MSDYSPGEIEQRLDSMEKKLNASVARLEDSVARLDQHLKSQSSKPRGRIDRFFWGTFIVLIGLLWFSSSAGWIHVFAVSWWPVVFIAFGLYLMLGGGR